jgi:glycosyltransferase involved in cell wall biosynthesis
MDRVQGRSDREDDMAAEPRLDRIEARTGPVPNRAPLPHISVVVPSYNQGRFLSECLDSIFRQDYPHLEVVVMDGGSTDDSVDIIRSHASRIKYWQSQRDGGQSPAINAGVQNCTGDLVTWLNSDDFYWDDALWVIGRAWMQHPGRGLYIGNGLRYEQASGRYQPFLARHVCLHRRGLLEGPDYILQPSTFFLRDAWHAVGGLKNELRFCMDWDIFLRLTPNYPIVAVNEFVGVSREYEDTKTRSGGVDRVSEIIRMIQSHSGKELTTGTLCYLLDTALKVLRGELSPDAHDRVHDGLVRALGDFAEDFGDGAWCPAFADPMDDTYLPFMGREAPRRPRPADAPLLPSFSIVIPVQDDCSRLDETLISIAHQDYRDLEIVIVAAPTAVLPSAEALRGPVRIVHCDSARQAALINKGLAEARGEVVTWVEVGDLLADGALEAAGAAFAEAPELGLLYGNALFLDPEGRPCVVDLAPFRTAYWYGRFEPPREQPGYDGTPYSIPQSTLCVRRQAFLDVGPLNETHKHIHLYEWFLRFAGQRPIRKLERTQALCRMGAREEAERWKETLVELYRFSRPRWPRWGAKKYRESLERFSAGYMHRNFGLPKEVSPTNWIARLVRLVARLRFLNPERWFAHRFPVPARGSPPMHIPLPEPSIRPILPLPHTEEAPRREGTVCSTIVCLPRAPRQTGVVGTEARELHILNELLQWSAVELFTFRATKGHADTIVPDLLSTPERPVRCSLERLWRGLPRRPLPLRIVDGLRRLQLPVLGPTNPLHVSRQFARVRGFCATSIQDRLKRKLKRPDFLFVGDQSNPLPLALRVPDPGPRVVLIAHESEAARLERLGSSTWGVARLASALEARRGRHFEDHNLEHVDGILVADESDKKLFVERYGYPPDRIYIAGRTVDTDWWGATPRLPTHPPIVAFFGNLDDPRDAAAAIRLARRTFPRVRKKVRDACCWILDLGARSKQRPVHIGAAQVIAVTGDARRELAQVTVACLPLGEGNLVSPTTLELTAAGIPLVATPAAVAGLAVSAGEHYQSGGTDAELAAGVVQLLSSPEHANTMARTAQEQVQRHHSIGAQLGGLRGWLEELARRPRHYQDPRPGITASFPVKEAPGQAAA